VNSELFPSPPHSFQRLLTAPAAGHRTNDAGTLLDAGLYGRCWSSSPYASGDHNAGYLRFWAKEVTPLYNMKRANAISVRCVQHLPNCFFTKRNRNRAERHSDDSARMTDDGGKPAMRPQAGLFMPFGANGQ